MRTGPAPQHVAVETEMIQRLRGLQGKLNSLVKKMMKKSKVAEAKPLIRMSLGKGNIGKDKINQDPVSK